MSSYHEGPDGNIDRGRLKIMKSAEGEIRTPGVQGTTSSQGWRRDPDLATSAWDRHKPWDY